MRVLLVLGAAGLALIAAALWWAWPGSGDASFSEMEVVQVDGFSIGRTEVTVAEYRACVDAGACSPAGWVTGCNVEVEGRDRHPVNCVDWFQASAFCSWRGARLPTGAEWFLAAYGPDRHEYPWGDEAPTCERAVLAGCGEGTRPVGGRLEGASPYGALDMAGNVWEWTASFDETGVRRVQRGASWHSKPEFARSSVVYGVPPDVVLPYTGFRCAVDDSG